MTGLDRKIEALFERHRRDAVLLHRPFPPHVATTSNSRLGGLPNLPDHYDWPRTSAGVPLHFLAQIDCAEISFPTLLPDRGVLFFFARDDEEQLWGDGDPHDDCRVIYARDAFARTLRRPPPPDLPAIGGSHGRSTHSAVAIGRIEPRGAPGSNLHVEWPVQFHLIDSWPEPSAYSSEEQESREDERTLVQRLLLRGSPEPDNRNGQAEFYERYLDLLNRRQAAELVAATGKPLGSGRSDRPASGRTIFGSADADAPFPDHWVYIHFFARLVLHRYRSEAAAPTERDIRLDAAAEDWLDRSRRATLEAPVPDDVRREFRAWARGITHERPAARGDLDGRAADFVFGSAVWAIRTWAHDKALFERIPPAICAATETFLASDFADAATDRQGRSTTAFDFQFAQMLGHAPSSQQAKAAEDPTICLLSLRSDRGIPWMFWDVGECTFWISPGDLARRDFSKAWLTADGG